MFIPISKKEAMRNKPIQSGGHCHTIHETTHPPPRLSAERGWSARSLPGGLTLKSQKNSK